MQNFGVTLQIKSVALQFNVRHFRNKPLRQKSLIVKNRNVIPVKIMIEIQSMFRNDRLCIIISADMIPVFGDSCPQLS